MPFTKQPLSGSRTGSSCAYCYVTYCYSCFPCHMNVNLTSNWVMMVLLMCQMFSTWLLRLYLESFIDFQSYILIFISSLNLMICFRPLAIFTYLLSHAEIKSKNREKIENVRLFMNLSFIYLGASAACQTVPKVAISRLFEHMPVSHVFGSTWWCC